MRVETMLKTSNYDVKAAIQEIKTILSFPPDDLSPIYIYEFYHEDNLTVYKWSCGEFWGFLRDDLSGWSGCTVFQSHDDELWLAAQFADYNALVLKRSGDKIDWKSIIALAKKYQWMED